MQSSEHHYMNAIKFAKRNIIKGLLYTSLLFVPALANADIKPLPESELQQARADFQAARDAIQQGNERRYHQLAQKLTDYPLYPYLEYWDLRQRLSRVSSQQIEAFVKSYPDDHLTARLLYSWLVTQAKHERWQTFLDHYSGDGDTELQCYARRALYKTGHHKEAFDDIESLWLVGQSQPRACDPLFSAWRDEGGMTDELVWQRVELAMEQNQTYLVRYLERFLDPQQRQWSELWRKVHRHPELIKTEKRLRQDTPVVRRIIAHGVQRLARHHPSQAAELWDSLVMKYSFDEADYTKTENTIALKLALADAPEAMHWLTNLSESADPQIQEWRIKTALKQNDWSDAIYWMDHLYPERRNHERWRYWRARAYEALGQDEQAHTLYSRLALQRNYYGFLAADRLKLPYAFEDHPLSYTEDELNTLYSIPGIARAREFLALGDNLNARREWYQANRIMTEEQRMKAAKLADLWNWHNQAILTLAQTDYNDDLALRFPLPHQDEITTYSTNQNIDPAWAYALIRQESAFSPDARSPRGAMGLMQIMPRTGRLIARELKTRLKQTEDLLDIDTNIRLGVSYLSKVMNRFDQNSVLATAAYNAGSQRVKSWLPEEEPMDPDLWIENIPFSETRNYVKNIMAYSVIYDQRMERQITRLPQRMPEIPPLKQNDQ